MSDSWRQQLRTAQFLNTSGEIIPPFAAMELDYFAESGKSANELRDGNEMMWKCKKPSSSISIGRLVFNSAKPVSIGGYGDFQTDPFATALADLTTAMNPDDECGPLSGSWYVQKSGVGLLFRSYDSYKSHYVSATVRTIILTPLGGSGNAILFTTRTGGIAARTTMSVPHSFPNATVDLLDEVTGDYYSPNRTETVYNSTSITVAHSAGRPRQGKRIGTRYFIDVDDCS